MNTTDLIGLPVEFDSVLPLSEPRLSIRGGDCANAICKNGGFTSTAYQFSSIQKAKTPEAKANFASCPLRRVEAEVLIDALNAITGSSERGSAA